jgi:BirA family transcriptional regulator, biotin operon repressor / biotin---[acetyl-CoA-carboxylase] ligase
MSVADRLLPERLHERLRAGVIGRKIVVLERTSSTNDLVAEMSGAEPAEGLVVFAEEQTAGRGQRGNVWESAAGKGLYFSILLRPGLPVAKSARLTGWAAAVVASTIAERCALSTRVKPPNDIYAGEKKIAGVLVEMRAQPGGPHLAILGIGINVNQQRDDFSKDLRDQATSVSIATGRHQDRTLLAVDLLHNLDRTYDGVRARKTNHE